MNAEQDRCGCSTCASLRRQRQEEARALNQLWERGWTLSERQMEKAGQLWTGELD